jgi:hypothetical protein
MMREHDQHTVFVEVTKRGRRTLTPPFRESTPFRHSLVRYVITHARAQYVIVGWRCAITLCCVASKKNRFGTVLCSQPAQALFRLRSNQVQTILISYFCTFRSSPGLSVSCGSYYSSVTRAHVGVANNVQSLGMLTFDLHIMWVTEFCARRSQRVKSCHRLSDSVTGRLTSTSEP